MTTERILTVDEAAAFARVKPMIIRHWMRRGLPWFSATKTVGRRGPNDPRILESDLLQYIRSPRITELPPPPAPLAETPARRTLRRPIDHPDFDWRPKK